jgi:RNA polymerase sigma factor (sigma-70 family)
VDERTAAFEAVYTATFNPILGYVLRRCDCPEDAADVVAETFAIAWRRMDDIPPGEQARLWLYGVARKVLANHRRGAVRRQHLSDALAAETAVHYHRSAEDSAETTIGRVFRTLPEDERELLSLVAWEGLDNGEIAKVLGCTRNAVRIRLYRARKRLAQALATAGHDAGTLTTSGRSR